MHNTQAACRMAKRTKTLQQRKMYCNKTTKTFEPMEDVLEHARHDAHELMAVDSGCPLDPMAVDDNCWAPPVASPHRSAILGKKTFRPAKATLRRNARARLMMQFGRPTTRHPTRGRPQFDEMLPPSVEPAALAPEDSRTSPTAFTTSEVSDLLARLPEVFDLLTALKDLPTTLAGLIAQQADAHHKLKSQFDELDGRVNDLRMDHNTLEMAMQGSPLTAADQASFAADQDVIDKSNDDACQEGEADMFVGQPAPSFSPVPVAASPGPLFSPIVATSAWPASSVAYALQAPQSPYQRAALHPASCDCETCWTARGFPLIPPSAPPTANVSVVPPTPSPAGSSASPPALLTARASTSPPALPTAGVFSASPPAHDQAAAAPAVYSPLDPAHAGSSQTPLSPSPPSANSSDASPPFDWDRPNANVENSSHTPLSSPPPSANSSDVSRAYDWNRPNANVVSSVASGDHPVFSVHAVSQPLPVSPSPPPASPSPPGSTGSSPDASVAPVLSLSQIRLSETAPAPVEETLHRRSRTTSN